MQCGNESAPESKTAKKDGTAPTKPSISYKSGTSPFNNGWYNTDVYVKIVAGADGTDGSGAAKISYSTNGGTSYSTYNGTTYDGLKISSTCTIYAKTIDNAGNESVASDGYTVSIDKTKPTLGSLASTGTSSTEANITVTGSSDTGGSGIYQYRYYVGSSSTANKTNSSTSSSDNATVTGLTSGPTNACYVEVYDKAGNTSRKSSN